MRRIVSICLLALSAVALVAAAPAVAAKKKKNAKTPEITKVAPMRISIGGRLTITGKNFKSKRTANTVIFRAPNGRSAFAKPRRASRTKLVVVVPPSVSRLLTVANSRQKPTRLKLRVLAGTFSKFTSRRLSPVVTGTGEGDGPDSPVKVCKDDSDHDNDLLSNDLELSIGTDPCLEDTDGDAMTDGWEYWSARDLNIKAVPYPGERPFTNPLDPRDGQTKEGGLAAYSATDFDGDGLSSKEEYRAWRHTGSSFDLGRLDVGPPTPPDTESVLGYSDGTKASRGSQTPPVPAWRSASIPNYGLPNPTQPFPATYNLWGDGVYPGSSNDVWRDDERDADADGLSNWLESRRGPRDNEYWKGFWSSKRFEPAVETWKEKLYCTTEADPAYPQQRPGWFGERAFADLDIADPDVDGDGLLDGEDDQDNDDYINITELYEVHYDLDGNGNPGTWCGITAAGGMPSVNIGGGYVYPVNAFNPCAPDMNSRTCHDYIPFGE